MVYALAFFLLYRIFLLETFTFLDKARLFHSLGVNADIFLEIAILAGFDWIDTFPPLTANFGSFSFMNAVDFARNTSPMEYQQNLQMAGAAYMETYLKTRAMVRHHLVLTEEGNVVPLNHAMAPADMHEILGARLPNQVFLQTVTSLRSLLPLACLYVVCRCTITFAMA